MFADVTRIARLRTIDAESLVKKQLPSQRDFFRSHGIVCRNRHRFITRELRRPRLNLRLIRSGWRSRVSCATNDEDNGGKQQDFFVHSVCCKWMSNVRKRLGLMVLFALVSAACASNNDNAHTTATTFVSPPPRQMLRVETRASQQLPAKPDEANKQVDPNKPLLIFNLPNGKTFREGEEVVIDFSLKNANLKAEGGNYRVRYIVDDDEMKWVDQWDDVV